MPTKTKRINFEEPITDTFGIEVNAITSSSRVIITAIDRQGRPRSIVLFPQTDLEEVVNALWTLGEELGQPWATPELGSDWPGTPVKKGRKKRA